MQQCDANAIHDCLLTICRLDSVLAKAGFISRVNRYLMLGYEVAYNRIGHRLRGLDARLAVALDFDDVALLARERGRQRIEVRLGRGRKGCESRSELHRSRGDGLVLVEIAYGVAKRIGTGAGIAG